MARTLALSLLTLPLAFAAQAPSFVPGSPGPLIPSINEGGLSNGSLPKQTVVPGKLFDRFIQIWLENTDFEVANSTATFQKLAKQGILLDGYYALTHPSEPNYIASAGAEFFGLSDDDLYNIPANISTIVDLLEEKNVSWASYQESMPADGYEGMNASSVNYHQNPGNNQSLLYPYYERKHNPLIIFDSVANDPTRRLLQRNFNDIAADLNASAVPQWVMVTPNIVDDAHDTDVNYAAGWLDFWLVPLMENPNFNDNKTLILLTFDENEDSTKNNRVMSILLGGAVPSGLRGTTDHTYYTHYSSLTTVQLNWGLGCLGRGDVDPQKSNVFAFVAEALNYTGNNKLTASSSDLPLTNISGPIPGALNAEFYTPFAAPDSNAKCVVDGAKVFLANGLNVSFTADKISAPVNLTALNQNVPAAGPRNASMTAPDTAATSPAGDSSGSGNNVPTSDAVSMITNLVFAISVAGVATYFTL